MMFQRLWKRGKNVFDTLVTIKAVREEIDETESLKDLVRENITSGKSRQLPAVFTKPLAIPYSTVIF